MPGIVERATKFIVIDRDGVINVDRDDYVKCPEEWRPLPGSLASIGRLNRRGFRVAVATNQSGIGRGLFDRQMLEAIHAKMRAALASEGGHLDALVYCPHTPDASCNCRKPRPGLLREIERRWAISLRGVPFVGDSLADVLAAVAVGARPLLVRTGKGTTTSADPRCPPGVAVYDDLAAAVDALLDVTR